MGKALIIASMASMIDNFNRNNIELLKKMGYDITLAANFKTEDINSEEKTKKFIEEMRSRGYRIVHIDFSRKLSNFNLQLRSYKQVKKLLKQNFEVVHCNSPICSVLTRIAFEKYRKKYKSKLIYTAHGFHFYNGASLKSWVLFYPIEKLLSRWTDVLITINEEDYGRAGTKFHAKETVYIPGVGVDIKKFSMPKADRKEKRRLLGVEDNDFIILSVGELSERKNQKLVIDALYKIKEKGLIGNIVYLIAGRGKKGNFLKELVCEYGLKEHVKFLGYRTDIDELCWISDCFVHPSIREGLGIAALEAMASGLPLISADVNGIRDYTEDGVTGCCVNPSSINEMVKAIEKMHVEKEFREKCASNNVEIAKKFDIAKSKEIMDRIYREV